MLPLKCKIELPADHEPGSFGAKRKYDIHTGVDLYCRDGEPVYAIEDGIVSRYGPFTGIATGSDWWEDTDYLMVDGKSGKILYGEISINKNLLGNSIVSKGQLLGWVKRVIKHDKGRPTSMLHIELYKHGYTGDGEIWRLGLKQPEYLLDVTPLLRRELKKRHNKITLLYFMAASAACVAVGLLNYHFKWIQL